MLKVSFFCSCLLCLTKILLSKYLTKNNLSTYLTKNLLSDKTKKISQTTFIKKLNGLFKNA
ncbi:MAG: hypothetical protein B6I26_06690 [Desulfobacteraceae bacterium 4572_130]|nr:MAG: hypothetical protein B6I26_06690 [Desulfobacteraceae bacterium 4572_130]